MIITDIQGVNKNGGIDGTVELRTSGRVYKPFVSAGCFAVTSVPFDSIPIWYLVIFTLTICTNIFLFFENRECSHLK